MLAPLVQRLRALFHARAVERELDDEFTDHLARSTALYMARGLSADAAREAARREFGNVPRLAEESRDARGARWLHDRWRDLRYALRTLRRTPAFTTVAILTLTLGIGANTAIFTVVNAVLLRPLAYRDADRLVVFQYGERATTVAPGTYFDWKANAHAFAEMGAAEYWTPILSGNDKPREIVALHVSASIFPLLGVKPLLGRVPLPNEEHDGAHRVAVLRFDLWQTRFGADSAIIGHTITLDGEAYTVIGVMPRGFVFAPFWATGAQLWAPFVLDHRLTDRDASSTRVFARLRPGVSLAEARAEMATVTARLERAYPGTNQNVRVLSLHSKVVGNVRNALVILQSAVVLVMLIACANVAHLLLLRAAAREREFAVRTALGAARSRLLWQSLVESLVLSVAGGVGGLLLAAVGVRALVAISPPELPRLDTIGLDARAFIFLVAAVLTSSVLFGVAPALAASRTNVHGALKEGGRNASDSVRRRRFRGLLVGSEFTMALLLLVSAGLVIKSFAALLAVNTGFDRRDTFAVNVSLTGSAHAVAPRRAEFFQQMVERVRNLPEVERASAINHAPLKGDDWHLPFAIEGHPFAQPGKGAHAQFLVVQPNYFRTMGIPMRQGRDFSAQDVSTGTQVAIVSEYMARKHWPGARALGQRISVDDPAKQPDWYTVIGVVGNVHQSNLSGADEEQMYFPALQSGALPVGRASFRDLLDPRDMTFVVRSHQSAGTLASAIERIGRELDRDALVSSPFSLTEAVDEQFTEPRFYLLVLSAFAVVALTLAAVGIYGVISYTVARRQHEIGVRLALGAERRLVFRLIVQQGMQLAALGGAVGVVAALLFTRYLRSLLFGIQPNDPATFGAVITVLAVVALAACGIPALRATRIDPVTALRSE